ncbi:MAG: carbohydrate binding family 9 domain-containing protein [FCB group bacterium]|nr:carbohydrate binding family 9 domain-containing protein [FCB group bacterium]
MNKTITFLSVFLCGVTIVWGISPGDSSFDPEQYRHREVTAIHLDQPLKIDGRLDEDLYRTIPHTNFIQLEPDNGEPATEKTRVWVGYDDNSLYIGARLEDSAPDSIVGYMVRRDRGAASDEFQVAIDSYHDQRSGFYFIVNPVGAIQDGAMSNDGNFDDSWDGVWDWKTRIDEEGWTVEIRIPFSQLRFHASEGETVMGIGFGRQIQRRNEHSLNTYIPRGESGVVSHFATLRGIKNILPPKRFELLPYVTGNRSALPSKKENPFYNGKDSNLGFGSDLKLGIGNNITVDATLNPDFGQVEVDPATINLSAYETYYEEKRPFFVEGSSIFRFGTGGPTNRYGFNFSAPDFFYSRRIGRAPVGRPSGDWVKIPSSTAILGAAKISGKLPGQLSLGGLTAVTRREFAETIDSAGVHHQSEVEPLTFYNLIRLQKEFNQGRQGLGMIGSFLTRRFDDRGLRSLLTDEAYSGGVDGWTFFGPDKDWAVNSWLGFSHVQGSTDKLTSLQKNSSHYFQRPDATHLNVDTTLTSMNGYAGRILVNKEKGHVTFNAAIGFLTPGFESNDMGLTFGTDRINEHVVLGYKWYDPGKIFRYAQMNLAHVTNHNFEGLKINEMVFFFGFAQWLNYWSFNWFSGWGPETLSDTKLRGGPLVVSPSGLFFFGGFNSDGRKDVTAGAGLGLNRAGNGAAGWNLNSNLGWKLGTNLNIRCNLSYSNRQEIDQYVGRWEDSAAVSMYGFRYIVAQLDQKTLAAELRIDYTFTPTLSFQVYLQPYLATGQYSHFKEFARPKSYDFMEYGVDGASTIEVTDNGYILDPTGGDDSDVLQLWNPDFNYKSMIGNAVLRWEFKPGSTLFLVWTSNGNDFQHPGQMRIRRDLNDLLDQPSDNVLALKITYWFGR